MNFQVFNHYGYLNLEKYSKGRKDPTKGAVIPPQEYAQQWAYLEEDEDDDSSEDVDENIIIQEGGPSQAAPAEEPSAPILMTIPLAEVALAELEAPSAPEAPATEASAPTAEGAPQT